MVDVVAMGLVMLLGLSESALEPAPVEVPQAPPPTADETAPAPVEETPSLVGSWVMDLDAMKQSPGFTEATPEQRQQMLAMLSMMQVSFEFTEDTITSKMGFAGQVDETKDSYRIIDVSGSTFKIESTDASGTVSVIDARLDGDRLELTDPKAGSFQLKRP